MRNNLIHLLKKGIEIGVKFNSLNNDRNIDIINKLINGDTLLNAGKEFGLTRTRVMQIRNMFLRNIDIKLRHLKND